MGTDLGDLAVVRSIVELGHSLGLTVVAEGVEEDAARDQLAAMGCDVAQGYLISRPLSEERLEAWLQARTVQARGVRDETVLTLVVVSPGSPVSPTRVRSALCTVVTARCDQSTPQ